MRKLKIIEHTSLDGVMQVSGEDGGFPYGEWTVPYRPESLDWGPFEGFGPDIVEGTHDEERCP